MQVAHMIAASSSRSGLPQLTEVRAQVARMTASTVFATSPQLRAFLVFVVEAVLRGQDKRLKGYTIGVEVLRRDINFDPQLDPIVRVEATRLRRAIERYYAGPGAQDTILIDLPRGGYAPRIRWRDSVAAAVSPEAERLAPGNGMPTLRIAPFVIIGTPDTRVIDGESLSAKLCEAFALFDVVNVAAAAPPSSGGRNDYRLDGTVEYRGGGSVDLRFRLVDKADETVIWSRAFERLSGEASGDTERKVILELATSIVHPYGIIWAHDRGKQIGANSLDPRYRALIEAGEAIRSFDPAAHVRARAELERLTAIDPAFAVGRSILSLIYAREHLFGFAARPGDTPALDRALKAAREGIELKPQSARAYQVLYAVLFFRGENAAAMAAAEKAVALNPYDVLMLSDYGGRLIFAGEIDKGMTILRATQDIGVILPSWTHFYLFLAHYLRDEFAEARFHAGQLTSETHVFGQLARALIAHRDGQAEDARRAIQAILAIQPEWKAHARREIGKMITGPDVADRLVRDLAAAGLAEV
jgi:tetratricopeptide (TPR) repeat protein